MFSTLESFLLSYKVSICHPTLGGAELSGLELAEFLNFHSAGETVLECLSGSDVYYHAKNRSIDVASIPYVSYLFSSKYVFYIYLCVMGLLQRRQEFGCKLICNGAGSFIFHLTDILFRPRKTFLFVRNVPHGVEKLIIGIALIRRTQLLVASDYMADMFTATNYVRPKIFPPLPEVYMLPMRKNSVFTMIFLGALVPDKGLLQLLAGIEGLKGVNLRLQIFGWENGVQYAGSKADKDGYKNLCMLTILRLRDQNPAITIELHPFSTDPKEILRCADLVVVPSISEEGFGRIVVESWAAQSLVLVGDVPNLNKLVGNRINGFCVDFNKNKLVSSILNEIIELSCEETEVIKSTAISKLNEMWAKRESVFE